jgi:hypothetical protein
MHTKNKRKRQFFFLFLFAMFIRVHTYAQPAFSQTTFYKMIMNPAFTAITDTTLQKDTSKELTFLYKDKPYPQSYKYIMGILQIPIPKLNSGAGIMVNYNMVNYYLPGLFQNPFPTGPYQFINPNLVNTYYNELAAKVYYRYTFNNKVSLGIDIGGINYNFFFHYPGTNYVIHPYTIYSDVGMLYKDRHWLFGLSLGHDFTSTSNLPFQFDFSGMGFPNYPPFAYNALLEYRTNFKNTQLDIIASDYSNLPNFQTVVCFYHTLILGASAIYITKAIILPSIYTLSFCYPVMAGLLMFHDRLKVTLSYDIFPNSNNNDIGAFAKGKQNFETIITDRFN